MSKWLYLTDMAPKATIINLENGELREIMSSAVKDKAPAGLRRYTLEELSGGTYRETGEMMPITDELLDDLDEFYRTPNSWNYDWPHLQIERDADDDLARGELIINRLSAAMSQHPYDFQVTGLQRRYLMYYSDGNHTSQQRFERLIPHPDRSPFRRNGTLRRKYDWIYNSIMRDAGVPYPHDKKSLYGSSLVPCLYTGPAWVVRFTLDDHDPLLERCRVYVDDDGNFICSDWCQRHDYTSYSNGINLQMGLYTFDGWVTGPCMVRNTEHGWQPKSGQIKRVAVRELMKRAAPPVPKFDDTFAKAKAAVSKYSKPHSLSPASVDAGPITADAMAEALAAAQEIWAAKAAQAPAAPAIETSVETGLEGQYDNWEVRDMPCPYEGRILIAFDDKATTYDGQVYVATSYLGCNVDPSIGRDTIAHTLSRRDHTEGFAINEDGTWYMGPDMTIGEDRLSSGWYLETAAKYYYEHMTKTAVEAVLLEA